MSNIDIERLSIRYSPGVDWCSDIRLQRGTLAQQESEAKRQGVFETWETKARRDHAGRRTRHADEE